MTVNYDQIAAHHDTIGRVAAICGLDDLLYGFTVSHEVLFIEARKEVDFGGGA